MKHAVDLDRMKIISAFQQVHVCVVKVIGGRAVGAFRVMQITAFILSDD